MAKLVWDAAGTRHYETGVDRGVLYLQDTDGTYPLGVAWNGLVSVTENPSGAEASPLFADNIKYLNLISAEEFAATIEAYTYPVEFAECDGSASPVAGLYFGQQPRSLFGLCYRTLLGNDTEGQAHGYKIHIIYGAVASPSEKAFNSINDSPEAITFSWEINSTPAVVNGYSAVASIVVDSTLVGANELADLEDALYGTATPTNPYLPLPGAVITLLTPP